MGWRKCPACNLLMSDKATDCPHCRATILAKPTCPLCGCNDGDENKQCILCQKQENEATISIKCKECSKSFDTSLTIYLSASEITCPHCKTILYAHFTAVCPSCSIFTFFYGLGADISDYADIFSTLDDCPHGRITGVPGCCSNCNATYIYCKKCMSLHAVSIRTTVRETVGVTIGGAGAFVGAILGGLIYNQTHKKHEEEKPESAPDRGIPVSSVPIFYATDRVESCYADQKLNYGHDWGELVYGLCDINIPRIHTPGTVERPKWWKCEFSESRIKHIMTQEIIPLAYDNFFSRVGRHKDVVQHGILVFIHGFNQTFEKAARKTAQLVHDLGYTGAPILYSWPSMGTVDGYFLDEDTIRLTVNHLEDFLFTLRSKHPDKKISLIAHSMGNRALTESLVQMHRTRQIAPVFDEIILTAPDIDTRLFRHMISPYFNSVAARVTLYTSSDDIALACSRRLRKNTTKRVGEAAEVLSDIKGIDIIDASGLGTDLLGHGYYANTVSLIEDLNRLLEGKTLEKRNLAPAEKESGYWCFNASNRQRES